MAGIDVLIVGGGSSGALLANRLSADPQCQVALVEAGTAVTEVDVAKPERWPFIQGRNFDWAYTTTPQTGLADRRVPWPRGRGLGGSSNLHAMAHMRGDRSDFARWAEVTRDQRWSWEGLLPHFRTLERSSGGPVEVSDNTAAMPILLPGASLTSPLVTSYLAGWEELGLPRILDHNRGSIIGATPNALTIENGARVTTADAYLSPALSRSNLTVLDRAVVHRLVVKKNAVRGVDMTRNGYRQLLEADAVVLAAGSIGDPLLLMRSGIGDPEVLAAAGVTVTLESRQVGRNLHDHLLSAGNLYRARRRVPPSRLQLSEAMTYLSAGGPSASGPPEVVVGCVVAPSVSDYYSSVVQDLSEGSSYTLLFGVTHPTSRGSLSITGPDVTDAPCIDPAYLSTENDRALFRRAFDLARDVGHSAAMAEWRAEEILPGPAVNQQGAIDAFIARSAITHHHPVGTCRMGADDNAVVDSNLRLRGVDNLYVVDASVIPSITTGPVHAAVLAIAESFASIFRQ